MMGIENSHIVGRHALTKVIRFGNKDCKDKNAWFPFVHTICKETERKMILVIELTK